MIWPLPRLYLAGALALALVASHGWAYVQGRGNGKAAVAAAYEAQRAKLQARLDLVSAEARRAAIEIQDWREAQRKVADDLETEARADPLAPGRVPSADSLRRLKARWGEAPAR